MSAWKISLVTYAIRGTGRLVQRLSDAGLVRLARCARPFVRDPEARQTLEEVIGVLQTGPPYTTLVRRLLGESRHEELWDFVWGTMSFRPMTPTAAGRSGRGR